MILALNVFCPGSELRVFAKDDGCLIVAVEFSWARLGLSDLIKKGPEPLDMLPGDTESNVFRLSAGQGNHGLVFAGPGDGSLVTDKYVTRGGA